jgi:hypothetical protein
MKVYFYLIPQGPPDKAKYKPQLVALAEGLKSSGIEYHSNVKYYFGLFEKVVHPVHVNPSHYAAFVFGYEAIDNQECIRLARNFKKMSVPVIVYDWIASDLILKTSKNLDVADIVLTYHLRTAEKIKCKLDWWPIGFTRRVTDFVGPVGPQKFNDRPIELLWSHRVHHTTRAKMWDRWYSKNVPFVVSVFHDKFSSALLTEPRSSCGVLDTKDLAFYEITGRRHNPEFYRALSQTKIIDCCGGFENGRQFDSFKLWEGFIFGCCVIMIDLNFYFGPQELRGSVSARLPQPFVHYVPVRPDDESFTNDVFHKLRTGVIDIEKIAASGREFALENFSPVKCADFFLERVQDVQLSR